MPKTVASRCAGREGALCRGTIVYEVDDDARKAPYKLKILARFRGIPISQQAPLRHAARTDTWCPAGRASPAPNMRERTHDALEAGRRGARSVRSRMWRDCWRKRRNPRSQQGTGVSVQRPRKRCCGCYLAFSRISTRRHRLVADSGRVSARRTRSPMPAEFSSS